MHRLAPALLLAAAGCSNIAQPPRYSVDIFAEDTIPAHVTVTVTEPMQVVLNGAGFYQLRGQAVVLTPASLQVRGTGSATIASIDSMQLISVVPAGTPLDSANTAAIVGRMIRLTRARGDDRVTIDVTRP